MKFVYRVVIVILLSDNTALFSHTLHPLPQSFKKILASTEVLASLDNYHSVEGIQIVKRDSCSLEEYTKAINIQKEKYGSEFDTIGNDKIRSLLSNGDRELKDIVNELINGEGRTDGSGEKGGEEKGGEEKGGNGGGKVGENSE